MKVENEFEADERRVAEDVAVPGWKRNCFLEGFLQLLVGLVILSERFFTGIFEGFE